MESARSLQPVPEVTLQSVGVLERRAHPVVFRGLAANWPAVREWRFSTLAAQVVDRPVQLVVGDRETGATHFETSTLRRYLASLDDPPGDGVARSLKEFDLLAAAPMLRAALSHRALLPLGTLRSMRSWVGPAGARTGLHYDHLDNIAVQIIGRKTWRFARRGAVERLGVVSTKYDAWAVLAREGIEALAARGADDDLFTAEVGPGDVLLVPAGWWHEVTNLTPSLLFGGFHGAPLPVLSRAAWVLARQLLHRAGWRSSEGCTCHPRLSGSS